MQNMDVSLLLHVISAIPFHTFKGDIFTWLSQNQIFLTKIIFCSTKEFVQCLGYIMNMNPTQVDRVAYQELINNLLTGVAQEKVNENKQFYEPYNTMAALAKVDVQIRMFTPTNNKGQKVQTNALAVYARLPFARITRDLLEEVAPMITNKSEAKFVPLGLKYDKTFLPMSHYTLIY
eukprot:835405-Ditylum_brightwellii.AAC.1